jgi:hypothetical protein
MGRRIWKTSILVCTSALALLPARRSLACAGDEPSVQDATMFAPEVIGSPADAPFFFDPYQPFADGRQGVPDFAAPNLDEWDAFFGKRLSRKAWSDLLYKAPLERVESLVAVMKGQRRVESADAVFMDYPERLPLVAALHYVAFAKRVEPFATARTSASAWDPPRKLTDADRAKAERLVESATHAIEATQSPFLRQRYAMQIVRLRFYVGQYEETIGAFDKYKNDFSDKSSAAWRALGYKAGALYKSKSYGYANYIYSQLFGQFAPMRRSALWSFHPQDERDWNEALSHATSAREKAVLWQMFGIAKNGARAIREIYALDHGSDLIPLLLVREVNRAEVDASQGRPARAQTASLAAFLDQTIARGGKLDRPYVWDMAAGHLHAVLGQSAPAERALARAAKTAPNDAVVQRQLRASRFYAYLRGTHRPDADYEARLVDDMGWLMNESSSVPRLHVLLAWARTRVAQTYRKANNAPMALCFGNAEDDPLYRSPAQIDALIAILDKPNKSAVENLALNTFRGDKTKLVEAKALQALYAGDFKGAAKMLATVKTAKLSADPFTIHIRDCHDCDARARHSEYSKADFAQRLADLQAASATISDKTPALYFELANGLYNMTHYGNARALYVGTPFASNRAVYDTSRAEAYYKKALELSKDPEFRAKAAFMAAKCELGTYYNKTSDEKRKADFKAGRWFQMLRTEFASTRYYKDILRECGYFRSYVAP